VRSAFDIAVVGSGFAGSLVAMIARRLGRSVVLLDKARHPRFAIGESSTPLANLILEELCDRYALEAVRPLTKWGAWQKAHPEIACGLKRGFSFFHHQLGQRWHDDASHRAQLLVAASPNDAVADTHWFRADFDAYLARQAQQLGATLLEQADLWGVDVTGRRAVIQGRRGGQPLEIHADLVIDASGPRGFLHRALELPESAPPNMPRTEALFSHFTGVKRWEELHRSDATPPYPPDDAAVHHVFPGGWLWVLRFDNGLTSAGVALTAATRQALGLSLDDKGWPRLLEKLPSVQEQFAGAVAVQPFAACKQLQFLSGDVAGANWVLLPSAAGFIDPLLSTGFPLTLLGVERLAAILEKHWGRDSLHEEICGYSMQTTLELSLTERLVAALYNNMADPELFSALTLLYFAAASFTESTRRLGKSRLAGGTFLLGEHATFAPRARDCLRVAMRRPRGSERDALLRRINETIEPVNIAGLGDASRRNWYPALASDLREAAGKLDSSRDEVDAMLRRCGM
jgi:tetracycline 7-halogenase / FADH2 O2-dependent halogenase